MLDLQAPVLDDVEPGRCGGGGDLVVAEAELEPDRPRAGRDRLVCDLREVVLPAEDVDDVGRRGKRVERGVDASPEHLVDPRVDEAHLVVGGAEQVRRDEVAGALGLVGHPDDGDVPRASQERETLRGDLEHRHPSDPVTATVSA